MNLSIIQVYAPTTDYDDNEVDKFYEMIEETIATIPGKDFLINRGDWNTNVGKDDHEARPNATGK